MNEEERVETDRLYVTCRFDVFVLRRVYLICTTRASIERKNESYERETNDQHQHYTCVYNRYMSFDPS